MNENTRRDASEKKKEKNFTDTNQLYDRNTYLFPLVQERDTLAILVHSSRGKLLGGVVSG